ncbi:MAG: type II secretion system protein GspN [Myxococcota bacterium]
MGILKTLLKGLGYSVAFTLLTLFFTLVTFPEDRLREYVEVVAGQATGGRVNITELSLSGLGGVELTDAVLKMPPPETPEGASDRPGGMFQVQSMEVSASLFSLLDDVVDATFEGTVQGGQISGGHVVTAAERFELEIAEIAELRFGTAGLIIKSMIGADLRGTLGGKDLKVSYGTDLSTLQAELDLDLTDSRLVDPTIPTKQLGPLSLSTMSLGQVQLTIKAGKSSTMGIKKKKRGPGRKQDDTVIHLANVGASGGDVEFQFDDQSIIRIPSGVPMKQWGVDIHAAVRVKDAYIDHTIEKKGELEQPNKLLRMYFKQDPRMRAAMRDGVFGLTCKGTFARPNCRPTPTTIRGFKKRQPRFTSDEGDAPEESEEADKNVSESKGKKAPQGEPKDKKAKAVKAKENLKSRNSARTAASKRPTSTTARAKRPTTSRVSSAKLARDRGPNSRPNPVPIGAAARAVPTIAPPVRGRDEAYASDDDDDDEEEEEEDDDDDDDDDEEEEEEEEDDDDEEDEEDEGDEE